MEPACLVLPLNVDRIDTARQFLRSLDGDRRADYARSQARIGIDRETWFCAEGVAPMLIAYVEAADFPAAVSAFAASAEPFDLWFKGELARCTGLDLNVPSPLALPEMLSHFVAVPAGQ